MYEIRFNPVDGILYAVTEGFWTLEIAKAYQRDLDIAMADARARWGHLLLLVDARQSTVQSAEVLESHANRERLSIRSVKDRAAVVVSSSLLKMQAKRLMETDQVQAFLSISAAETWLTAHEGRSPNPAGPEA